MKNARGNSRRQKLLQKALTGFLAFGLLTLSLTAARPSPALGTEGIDIYVDGQLLKTDTPAYISEGRTLIPVRMLMEDLGAQVDWEPVNRTVRVSKASGESLTLWADNRLICYEKQGLKSYDLCDVAPAITGGRTYVPLRLAANALGLSVEWDPDTRRVSVDSSVPGAPGPFFDLAIDLAAARQTAEGPAVTGAAGLSLRGALPKGAAQVKYLLLDPVTGRGKVVARSTDAASGTLWIPEAVPAGPRILGAAVCDVRGQFLAGAVLPVNMAVAPEAKLTGVTEGQVLTGPTPLTPELNFMAAGVIYEFVSTADGSVSRTGLMDPQGVYNYSPTVNANGSYDLGVVAVDAAGQEYRSPGVKITISVPPVSQDPVLKLKSFKAANVGIVPVTLSVSRNFDVSLTQYWAKNTATGQTVLLEEKPWGDYSWFPGPDMAGSWEVYAVVRDTAGKSYASNSRPAAVPRTPSLILRGLGPGQVITGPVEISSLANVPVTQVSYEIFNPGNGSSALIGTSPAGAPSGEKTGSVTWTPGKVNQGQRLIQATALTASGTVKSEKVPVRIYLGQLYGSRPITEKSNFVDYVTPMALATQKQSGMSAALQVAQAILETGWGQSVPVDKYTGAFSNNLFGVKGSGSAGSVISGTLEEYYGTMYRTDAAFRAYRTVQESWDDHTAVLGLKRYGPYREVMFSSTWGAYALKRCGYATDSRYPAKLLKLIRDQGLDRLDEQSL